MNTLYTMSTYARKICAFTVITLLTLCGLTATATTDSVQVLNGETGEQRGLYPTITDAYNVSEDGDSIIIIGKGVYKEESLDISKRVKFIGPSLDSDDVILDCLYTINTSGDESDSLNITFENLSIVTAPTNGIGMINITGSYINLNMRNVYMKNTNDKSTGSSGAGAGFGIVTNSTLGTTPKYVTINFESSEMEVTRSNHRAIAGRTGENIEINVNNSYVHSPHSAAFAYVYGVFTWTPKSKINVTNSVIDVSSYGVSVVEYANQKMTVKNSKVTAWAPIYVYGANRNVEESIVRVDSCELIGRSYWGGGSSRFAAIVVQDACDLDMIIHNSTVRQSPATLTQEIIRCVKYGSFNDLSGSIALTGTTQLIESEGSSGVIWNPCSTMNYSVEPTVKIISASGNPAAELYKKNDSSLELKAVFSTINLALNAAENSNVILVKSGTYTESLAVKVPCTIKAPEGEHVIVNSPNTAPGIKIQNTGGISEGDFTVSNINFVGNATKDATISGFYIKDQIKGTVLIDSCVVNNYYIGYDCQGQTSLNNRQIDNLIIQNSNFEGNLHKAFYTEVGDKITIKNTIFNDNASVGKDYWPTRVSCDINLKWNNASKITIIGNTFKGTNTIPGENGYTASLAVKARTDGGYATEPHASITNLTMTDNTFTNNTVDFQLGEPTKGNPAPQSLTVEKNTFSTLIKNDNDAVAILAKNYWGENGVTKTQVEGSVSVYPYYGDAEMTNLVYRPVPEFTLAENPPVLQRSYAPFITVTSKSDIGLSDSCFVIANQERLANFDYTITEIAKHDFECYVDGPEYSGDGEPVLVQTITVNADDILTQAITVTDSAGNIRGSYDTLVDAFDASKTGDIIKLLANVTDVTPAVLDTNKAVVLDLNGKTWAFEHNESIKEQINAIHVDSASKLTINDNVGGGHISANSPNRSVNVISLTDNSNIVIDNALVSVKTTKQGVPVRIAVGCTATLNNGKLDATKATNGYGVSVWGNNTDSNASFIMNGGEISAKWYCISGNGTTANGGTNIVINRGSLYSTSGSTIYHPQRGDLTINNGSFVGYESSIGFKSGNLTIKDGTFKCTGPNEAPTEGYSNGMNASGAVLQIESNKSYYGNMNINISGGTFISDSGYAMYEYQNKTGTALDTMAVSSINVTGGTFIHGDSVKAFNMFSQAFTDSFAITGSEKGFISAGSYSSSPKNFLTSNYTESFDPVTKMYNVILKPYQYKDEEGNLICFDTFKEAFESNKIPVGAIIINKETGIDCRKYAGEGTEDAPFEITRQEDMAALAHLVKEDQRQTNKLFKVTNDIEINTKYLPIGSMIYGRTKKSEKNSDGTAPVDFSFDGIFDGDGKVITFAPGMKFEMLDNAGDSKIVTAGLFGHSTKGTLKNIKLVVNESIDLKGCGVFGAIVAYTYGGCTIQNVDVEINAPILIDPISGLYIHNNLGGIAGILGSVGNTDGRGMYVTVENCHVKISSTGKLISTYNNAAGIIAYASTNYQDANKFPTSLARNCSFQLANGAVMGSSSYVGGIMAQKMGIRLDSCFVDLAGKIIKNPGSLDYAVFGPFAAQSWTLMSHTQDAKDSGITNNTAILRSSFEHTATAIYPMLCYVGYPGATAKETIANNVIVCEPGAFKPSAFASMTYAYGTTITNNYFIAPEVKAEKGVYAVNTAKALKSYENTRLIEKVESDPIDVAVIEDVVYEKDAFKYFAFNADSLLTPWACWNVLGKTVSAVERSAKLKVNLNRPGFANDIVDVIVNLSVEQGDAKVPVVVDQAAQDVWENTRLGDITPTLRVIIRSGVELDPSEYTATWQLPDEIISESKRYECLVSIKDESLGYGTFVFTVPVNVLNKKAPSITNIIQTTEKDSPIKISVTDAVDQVNIGENKPTYVAAYRTEKGSNLAVIASDWMPVGEKLLDTTYVSGKSYTYTVVAAADAKGIKGPSDASKGKVYNTMPHAPQNFVVKTHPQDTQMVVASWNRVDARATYNYNVYRYEGGKATTIVAKTTENNIIFKENIEGLISYVVTAQEVSHKSVWGEFSEHKTVTLKAESSRPDEVKVIADVGQPTEPVKPIILTFNNDSGYYVQIKRYEAKSASGDGASKPILGKLTLTTTPSVISQFADKTAVPGVNYAYDISYYQTAKANSTTFAGSTISDVAKRLLEPVSTLNATQGVSSSVKLTWKFPQGAKYAKVFVAETADMANMTPIQIKKTTEWAKATSTVHTPEVKGKAFFYAIQVASDNMGSSETELSAPVSGWSVLTPPTKVRAGDVSPEFAMIRWDISKNANEESDRVGFLVGRSANGKKDAAMEILTVPGGSNVDYFHDVDAVPGVVYTYFVTATGNTPDSMNMTRWSNGAKAYKQLPAATEITPDVNKYYDRITVAWNRVPNAEAYYLYRSVEVNDFAQAKLISKKALTEREYYDYDMSIKAKDSVFYFVVAVPNTKSKQYGCPTIANEENDGSLAEMSQVFENTTKGVVHVYNTDSIAYGSVDAERPDFDVSVKPQLIMTQYHIDPIAFLRNPNSPKFKKGTMAFVKDSYADTTFAFQQKATYKLYQPKVYKEKVLSANARITTEEFLDDISFENGQLDSVRYINVIGIGKNHLGYNAREIAKGVFAKPATNLYRITQFIHIAPPRLNSAEPISLVEGQPDSWIRITGEYFGTTTPKAWLEWRHKESVRVQQVSLSARAIAKDAVPAWITVRGINGSWIQKDNGESAFEVKIPKTWATNAPWGNIAPEKLEAWIVIQNGVGYASIPVIIE